MQEALRRYRERIQSGDVNPLVNWDGKTSGVIFDPSRDDVPLTMLGFGAYRLEDGPFEFEAGEAEWVLIPMCGRFEVKVGGQTFAGAREGGPFATLPVSSNAWAIYVGRDERVRVAGEGELVWFSGPARGKRPAGVVKPGERENLSRGSATWRRDVVTLVTPEDLSTNLVVGETYSPPGLWSGTPLHVHDRDAAGGGESDHEEVYYHVARVTEGRWGPYGVQLLFDEAGLDRSYLVHHRSAFAIPGAAHPVVAGPVSDMLYVWGLAGKGSQLLMRDVEEFGYIKSVGAIIDELDKRRGQWKVSEDQLRALIKEHGLRGHEAAMLRLHLRERGYEVGWEGSV